MIVVVKETWTATFQAQKAMSFTGDDGEKIEIPASDAHTACCALVSYADGSGVCVVVEIPETYTEKVCQGDTLHIQCKSLQLVDRVFKVKNVLRRIPAGKDGK